MSAFVGTSVFGRGGSRQLVCQPRGNGGRGVGRFVMMAKKPSFNPNKIPSKEKVKLDPEEVFMDVRPSATEILIPFISILTVVGIIPFIAAAARQLWVRYKITSRRISIQGGFQGKDTVEVIYRDIEEIRYVKRLFGASGDMVLTLKDGAKLEMRAVPDFNKAYEYIMSRVDASCREKSSGFAGKPVEAIEAGDSSE